VNLGSVIWAISIFPFLGGLGSPVPENPVLVGGGYAIYQGVASPVPGLCLWYLAILCGDFILFTVLRSFFSRPSLSNRLKRWTGRSRFEKYQQAFISWGGWTLFLALYLRHTRSSLFCCGSGSLSMDAIPSGGRSIRRNSGPDVRRNGLLCG